MCRIGALNVVVEGGLAQISVDGNAFMIKPFAISAAEGTAWVEFVNLRPAMFLEIRRPPEMTEVNWNFAYHY